MLADLTGKNLPGSGPETYHRRLAVVLDGQVMSAPINKTRVEGRGQITGDFTWHKVDLVQVLRSKPLPMILKPSPVQIIAVQPAGDK